MDFRTPGTGSQPWASYQHHHSANAPANFNHQLNPSVPGFQPTGAEMLRFQYQPPTPPSSNNASPGDMTQMRNYVLNSHFSYTRDITGLERKTQKNLDEIEDIKDTVRRDMQTLQGQIEGLKVHVNEQNSGVLSRRSRVNGGLPGRSQVTEDFTNESMAELYLEEADVMEATAAKLREQAAEMTGRDTPRKLVTMKLIEGPKADAEKAETKAEFACCGETYASVQELLEHVNETHGSTSRIEQPEDVRGTSTDVTPTHVPPRRSKPNTAVEIKAPESAEEQKLKAKIAEIRAQLEAKTKAEQEKIKSSIEDKARASAPQSGEERWMPLAVHQMPEIRPLNHESNTETFTWEFLKLTFEGEQWSPGYYFISSKNCKLPSKAYWVLDAEFEPYLPKAPGQHGAKLTAFFNGTDSAPGEAPDEINYINTPVFICPEGKKEYVYFGNFSQKRFSDKLDYDHVVGTVSEKIRRYWADQLAAAGRPQWVTQELIQHFWPKPTYCGPIPTDSAVATPVTAATPDTSLSEVLEKRVMKALQEYAMELKEWKKESEMKVCHLTADNLMAAFNNADADEEPGLRFWWEYMEFVEYDQAFYDFLVLIKGMEKGQNSTSRTSASRKTKVNVGGKIVGPASGVETVIPDSSSKLQLPKHSNATLAAATGMKRHTAGVKPWEQAAEELESANNVPGDSEAAKTFQANVSKNHASGAGRKSDESKAPPHLRRGK